MADCPFCRRILEGKFDEAWRFGGGLQVRFEPLDPVTPGHMLIISGAHVASAIANPYITGETMEAAATYASRLDIDCNIITSVGSAATQTVRHLHIHVVPRRLDDGLKLPWTGQRKAPVSTRPGLL